MKEERVILCAYWQDRRLTGREFIRLCHEFLARLRDFSTAFQEWCVAVEEGRKIVPAIVPKDYDAFEQLLIKAVPSSKYAYTNPDSSNQDFTLDSTTPLGFMIPFSDAGSATSPPTSLSVSITAGAYGEHSLTNVVLIEIPPDYRVFWSDKQRAKDLMEIVALTWRPAFATLTSSELRQALDPKHANNFPIGALTYFADEKAGGVAGSAAKVEPASGGGVFLSIDGSYPWALDVNRFRPCFTRLESAGLLRWPRGLKATG